MTEKSGRPRLIVGISGASGVIYGARLLELLRPLPVETHLVISRAAEVTLALETDLKPAVVRSRADVVHVIGDLAAPISSGSFKTIGMVVAPCSIRSMAEIASGVTTTLLSRAADVVLKERRRLVLMVRETPLHTGHLRTLTALSEMGAMIAPPVPAFYANRKRSPSSSTRASARCSTCSGSKPRGQALGRTLRAGPPRSARHGVRRSSHSSRRTHRALVQWPLLPRHPFPGRDKARDCRGPRRDDLLATCRSRPRARRARRACTAFSPASSSAFRPSRNCWISSSGWRRDSRRKLAQRFDNFASQRAGRSLGHRQRIAAERSAPRHPEPERKQHQVYIEAVAVLQRDQRLGDPRPLVEGKRETPEPPSSAVFSGSSIAESIPDRAPYRTDAPSASTQCGIAIATPGRSAGCYT